jgi:serine/threonine protein kinase
MKDEILNIKALFASSNESIHKARNELKITHLLNQSCVIKAFKVPNILNQIVYAYFRDSKAKKSYEYSLKLKDFTPQPIAYLEFYNFGLFRESYFISETFEYDFTIREPLLDKNFEDREAFFEAFARFTLELHNNNIFHNDYSPGNILIKKDEAGYIFKIVDINRMKFYELSQEDRAKNFSKLWADDAILKIIATEYAKHYECDANFTQRVLYYSNQNKKVKNFKKRLKGKEVVD